MPRGTTGSGPHQPVTDPQLPPKSPIISPVSVSTMYTALELPRPKITIPSTNCRSSPRLLPIGDANQAISTGGLVLVPVAVAGAVEVCCWTSRIAAAPSLLP